MPTEQPTIEELTAQIADMQERLNERFNQYRRNEDQHDRILKAVLDGRVLPYERIVLEFHKYSAVDPEIIRREFDKIVNRHSP